MNPFLREKPDGRRAPGYLVYLLAGSAMVLAVFGLRRAAATHAAPRRPRSSGSNIEPITQPAALMTPVDVRSAPPSGAVRSYRLETSPKPASGSAPEEDDDSFAPIGDAFKPADSDGAKPSAPSSPSYAELPPAFSAEPENQGASDRHAGGPWFDYREPAQAAAAPASDAAPARLVPRGSLIRACLLTAVDTGNPAAVIQFGILQDFFFGHRRLLAFGTRCLGRLQGPALRDRINLKIDTLLYPNGLELPVSATAVEADEDGDALQPGLAAVYVPPPAWAQTAPYLSDLVTGYLGLLQTRANAPMTLGLGGLTLSSGAELKAPLDQASSQAIQDFTQARLKEWEQRYAACYVIPAGAACWLQLDADLDLSRAPDIASHDSPSD